MPTPRLARGPHRIKLEFAVEADVYRALQAHLRKDEPLTEEQIRDFYAETLGKVNFALKKRFLGHQRFVIPRFAVPDPPNSRALCYGGISLNGKSLQKDPIQALKEQ